MVDNTSTQGSTHQFDVVIVGGAMVGSVLALGLALKANRLNKPLNIALVEAYEPTAEHPGFDARAIALSHGTIEAFKNLDIWDDIKHLGTDISRIHISDRGHFGMTQLDAQDFNLDAMGAVVELSPVGFKLHQKLQSSDVTMFCPAKVIDVTAEIDSKTLTLDNGEKLNAKLVVAADGANSIIRQSLNLSQEFVNFEQTAIIANIELEQKHQHRAWERFTDTGPLALLPMSELNGRDRLSLVWALTPEQAEEYLQLSDDAFIEKLQQAFGYRAGKLIAAGKRFSYPLIMTCMPRPIHHRTIFVGNAAQTLHPIAGQGFNLGLRDIMTVIDVVENGLKSEQDLGSTQITHTYLKQRQEDRGNTLNRVEFLVRGFSNNHWPLVCGRSLGLRLLSYLPFLKAPVGKKAMGFTTQSHF
ncbi:2-octaprenyl-6-methoxyphenyl hydroxylase [Shewanella sp. OPT22]|nr:2-octaprenyl-6-methoxyphenyl hydroxylase [Shewanella sp. OPT22]